ncbi:MAG TPA: hypothetical protein VFF56_01305, partial [Bacillota bacterium]|nr:hypothetical protein [Bacillota bacterium]
YSKMQMRQSSVNKWKRLLEEQALSGLSIKAWCEEKDLAKSSFYRYRKLLRELETSGSAENMSWQEIKLMPEPKRKCGIRLYLNKQMYLELESGFDVSLLQEIVEVLSC